MGLNLQKDVGDGFDVRSLGLTYREGHVVGKHTHPWAQLIYARTGLMQVETPGNAWVVPPTKAVWIPPATTHLITFRGEVVMRTLYISASRAEPIQRRTATLAVSPLLSHLIQHIQSIKMLNPNVPKHDHLAGVLIDLVIDAPEIDLALPNPKDERAIRLANYIRANPADKSDLSTLSKKFAASLRTMQRYFVQETGLPLDAWRQKARLIQSVTKLTSGSSVTAAAIDCGYDSSSAFIATFKKHFGVTPGRFRSDYR